MRRPTAWLCHAANPRVFCWRSALTGYARGSNPSESLARPAPGVLVRFPPHALFGHPLLRLRPRRPHARRPVRLRPPLRLSRRPRTRRRRDAAAPRPKAASSTAASATAIASSAADAYRRGMAEIRIGIGGWTYEPWRGTFYPDKWPHKRELEYASRAADRDRGQRHLLFGVQAGDASRRGRSRARRLRVHAQGVALLHQSQGAGGGRRVDRAFHRAGASSNSAPSSARSCGSSWRPRSSTPTISARSSKLLPRQRRTASRCATRCRCGTTVSHVPEFVDMCRAANVAIVYADSADYPAIADVTGRLRLCAAGERGRGRADGLFRPRRSTTGPMVATDWAAGGAPDGLPYVGDAAAEDAARHVRLLDQRREGARARRRAGADRAGLAVGGRRASPGVATRPCSAAALQHVERLARLDIAPRRVIQPVACAAPGSCATSASAASTCPASSSRRTRARRSLGTGDGVPARRRTTRLPSTRAQARPSQPSLTRRCASCGPIASSAWPQILDRHRLARGGDDRRDRARLGRAEPRRATAPRDSRAPGRDRARGARRARPATLPRESHCRARRPRRRRSARAARASSAASCAGEHCLARRQRARDRCDRRRARCTVVGGGGGLAGGLRLRRRIGAAASVDRPSSDQQPRPGQAERTRSPTSDRHDANRGRPRARRTAWRARASLMRRLSARRAGGSIGESPASATSASSSGDRRAATCRPARPGGVGDRGADRGDAGSCARALARPASAKRRAARGEWSSATLPRQRAIARASIGSGSLA